MATLREAILAHLEGPTHAMRLEEQAEELTQIVRDWFMDFDRLGALADATYTGGAPRYAMRDALILIMSSRGDAERIADEEEDERRFNEGQFGVGA